VLVFTPEEWREFTAGCAAANSTCLIPFCGISLALVTVFRTLLPQYPFPSAAGMTFRLMDAPKVRLCPAQAYIHQAERTTREARVAEVAHVPIGLSRGSSRRRG
jgi:hypothetical protein